MAEDVSLDDESSKILDELVAAACSGEQALLEWFGLTNLPEGDE